MRIQDRGNYAKVIDHTGKLYIPLVYTDVRKKPCKRFFRRASEAQDYSKELTIRYERLKAYARNQSAN